MGLRVGGICMAMWVMYIWVCKYVCGSWVGVWVGFIYVCVYYV